MDKLPRFYELALPRLNELTLRDKIITIKISRNTAWMMVNAEREIFEQLGKSTAGMERR